MSGLWHQACLFQVTLFQHQNLKPRGWVGEGREAQEGGTIGIITADLHCGMAETSTTLESNFPPIKKLNLKAWVGAWRACLLPSSQEKQGPEQEWNDMCDRKWGSHF